MFAKLIKILIAYKFDLIVDKKLSHEAVIIIELQSSPKSINLINN